MLGREVTYVYVHVTTRAREEFDVAQKRGAWGWRRRIKSLEAQEAFEALAKPDTDLRLVMGRNFKNAGGTRVAEDDVRWLDAAWGELLIARVTTPLHHSEELIWADYYPWQVRFEPLLSAGPASRMQLSEGAFAALKFSSKRLGQPALGPEPFLTAGSDVGLEPGLLREADADLGVEMVGSLDRWCWLKMRREQARLRKGKFGDNISWHCDLCGRLLPTSLLRLAHIKPRARCTFEELTEKSNTMAACTLGCDELFERGYLVVGPTGRIDALNSETADLEVYTIQFRGRTAASFDENSAQYFRWHLEAHSSLREIE